MISPKRKAVNMSGLPTHFPTHQHAPEFWTALGRAIATFGFLEEILGKAIFAFTATQECDENEIELELQKWHKTLINAIVDPLSQLIILYEKSVSNNQNVTITNLDKLIGDLRAASKIRNVLCHGSWRLPDSDGKSIPLFVSKQGEIFETAIDIAFLEQVQRHVAELSCSVINTVSYMGYQFPGTNGHGKSVL